MSLTSDANAVLVVGDDSLGLEDLVPTCELCCQEHRSGGHLQLGTSAVQDNGVEAETVEERQRESKVLELVGEDGSANPVKVRQLSAQTSHDQTHFRTANLASGSTPPAPALDDWVKMRR